MTHGRQNLNEREKKLTGLNKLEIKLSGFNVALNQTDKTVDLTQDGKKISIPLREVGSLIEMLKHFEDTSNKIRWAEQSTNERLRMDMLRKEEELRSRGEIAVILTDLERAIVSTSLIRCEDLYKVASENDAFMAQYEPEYDANGNMVGDVDENTWFDAVTCLLYKLDNQFESE